MSKGRASRWRVLGWGVCALVSSWCAAAIVRADAPPEERFRSTYGEALTRAAATPGAEDDLAVAARVFEDASHPGGEDSAYRVYLYDEVYELSAPAGESLAVAAMEACAAAFPAEKDRCAGKVLAAYEVRRARSGDPGEDARCRLTPPPQFQIVQTSRGTKVLVSGAPVAKIKPPAEAGPAKVGVWAFVSTADPAAPFPIGRVRVSRPVQDGPFELAVDGSAGGAIGGIVAGDAETLVVRDAALKPLAVVVPDAGDSPQTRKLVLQTPGRLVTFARFTLPTDSQPGNWDVELVHDPVPIDARLWTAIPLAYQLRGGGPAPAAGPADAPGGPADDYTGVGIGVVVAGVAAGAVVYAMWKPRGGVRG